MSNDNNIAPAVPSPAPGLSERMELANRIDAIARSLSYNGEKREGDAKHRLREIVASLGGTGALAAPVAQPERRVWSYRRYGSPPEKGYTIIEGSLGRLHGDTVAFLGDGPEAGEAAHALCVAHNAAFGPVVPLGTTIDLESLRKPEPTAGSQP
jgi:hypothetical protein